MGLFNSFDTKQGSKETELVPTLAYVKGNIMNNRDLFYVIALFSDQLRKSRRWHYQQNRDNAAARMRRYKSLNDASADAGAKEYNTVG